jgi:Fic family protein
MRKKKQSVPLLPFDADKFETYAIMRKEARVRQALAELKGFAPVIPNQDILINAISLQEARESSAIENIVITEDELYQNITSAAAKEVINYRKAVYKGCQMLQKRHLIRYRTNIEADTAKNQSYQRFAGINFGWCPEGVSKNLFKGTCGNHL